MSEIELLYKNAGVEKREQGYCDWDSDCPYPDIINSGCGDECPYWKYEDEATYPPFTAEKQLELIKWLSNFWMHINKVNEQFNISTGGGYVSYYAEYLADAIALYINSKWNNLTEQERTEIADILK